jgi:uncharacterized membrane protein (Fun14 family)
MNPKVVRQISMGSILGVLGGLGISIFSKPLALLIGLGIVLVQVGIIISSWLHTSYLGAAHHAPSLDIYAVYKMMNAGK